MSYLSISKTSLAIVSLAGLLTACQTTGSMPDRDGDREGHAHWFKHHGPRQMPPEIANACVGKNAGDAVTITLQNGKTIQGTCALRFKPDFKARPTGDVEPSPPTTAQPTH